MSNLDSVPSACAELLKFCTPAQKEEQTETTLSLFAPKVEECPTTAIKLEISFVRAPKTHRVPIFAALPHEVNAGSICLVTPSPQSKYKEALEAEGGADSVKRVIDVEKLKAKFSEPVALRALAKSFDNFYVHNGVKAFPVQLTGEFLNHRTPVWLASDKSIATAVAKTANVSVLPRRGKSTVSMPIGHTKLSAADLEENIRAALEKVAEESEDSWSDILSVRLCGTNPSGKHAALPIFAKTFVVGDDEELVAKKKRTQK